MENTSGYPQASGQRKFSKKYLYVNEKQNKNNTLTFRWSESKAEKRRKGIKVNYVHFPVKKPR